MLRPTKTEVLEVNGPARRRGQFKQSGLRKFGPFNARWADLKDLTPLERVSGGLLIGSVVVMGVWWAPFIDRISATVIHLPGVTG